VVEAEQGGDAVIRDDDGPYWGGSLQHDDDFDLDRPALPPLAGLAILAASAIFAVLGWYFFAREMIRIWW